MIASTSPELGGKESLIVYWKVEDSGKNAEDEAPDRMLPWVIDLLKRLPRRLHSDGEEFVFLTPVPPRGFGRRPSVRSRADRLYQISCPRGREIVIRLPN